MKEQWNSTCILFDENGLIHFSEFGITRHNEALKNCAQQIHREVNEMQSMRDMFKEIVLTTNSILLLNSGLIEDEQGVKKKSGFLALPDKFTEKQLEIVTLLLTLVEDYGFLTTSKIIDNNLKSIYNIKPKNLIESMIPQDDNGYSKVIR